VAPFPCPTWRGEARPGQPQALPLSTLTGSGPETYDYPGDATSGREYYPLLPFPHPATQAPLAKGPVLPACPETTHRPIQRS